MPIPHSTVDANSFVHMNEYRPDLLRVLTVTPSGKWRVVSLAWIELGNAVFIVEARQSRWGGKSKRQPAFKKRDIGPETAVEETISNFVYGRGHGRFDR